MTSGMTAGPTAAWGNGSGGPLYEEYGKIDDSPLQSDGTVVHPSEKTPHWSEVMKDPEGPSQTHPSAQIATANVFKQWFSLVESGNEYRQKIAASGQAPRVDQLQWLDKNSMAVAQMEGKIRAMPLAAQKASLNSLDPYTGAGEAANLTFPELFEDQSTTPSALTSFLPSLKEDKPLWKQRWVQYAMGMGGLAYVVWWYGRGK